MWKCDISQRKCIDPCSMLFKKISSIPSKSLNGNGKSLGIVGEFMYDFGFRELLKYKRVHYL